MINYVTGDATKPPRDLFDRPRWILHVCNDIGVWGGGFTRSVSKLWPHVGDHYKKWATGDLPNEVQFTLGNTQFAKAEPGIFIANMVAQSAVKTAENPRPLNYGALAHCLGYTYAYVAHISGGSVHMPRIGSDLAGGSWEIIEEMINFYSQKDKVETTVYTLP